MYLQTICGGVNILDMFTGKMDCKKIILVFFSHSFNKYLSTSLAPLHMNVPAKKDKVTARLVEFLYFCGGGWVAGGSGMGDVL